MSFEENLDSATKRIKADVENCYNLLMKARMSHLDFEKLELLREIEQKMYKTHLYLCETIKMYQ